MPATQTAALAALLATMTPVQRTALLDVLGMHIENVETNDEDEDLEDTLASEGHTFLVAMCDATAMTFASLAA